MNLLDRIFGLISGIYGFLRLLGISPFWALTIFTILLVVVLLTWGSEREQKRKEKEARAFLFGDKE